MQKLISRFWTPVVLVVLVALFSRVGDLDARQAGDTVTLTVRLRAADGKPVAGEPVVLQWLPDEDVVPPSCRTNATGACTWLVARGLYQVLFARPLDGVSALALAEGGLSGFGLTVGDEAITYHFTVHDDGRVYFDAAPDAEMPVPIIPTPELLQGGVAPTETAAPEPTPPFGQEGASPDGVTTPPAVDGDSLTGRQAPRLALYALLGLAASGSLHLYSRRRQRPANSKEEQDA